MSRVRVGIELFLLTVFWVVLYFISFLFINYYRSALGGKE